MNKEAIYLVGQISVDVDETYAWRKRVRTYFANTLYSHNIEVIDPCANEFNQSVKREAMVGIDNMKRVYLDGETNLLVPKDMSYVKQSSIGMANLNVYDPNKLIVGSFFELAWYIASPDKSVVGIFNGDPEQDRICMHPFVRRAVDVWVKNEYEACKVIERFFINV
jgi:hypothetical protein